MADHAHQHRERDIVDRADAEPGHHQVLEHEHPGAHFRDAGEISRTCRRRRGPHAHDRGVVLRSPKPFGSAHDRRPFLFGHGDDGIDRPAVVRRAGVGHHAAAAGAGRQCGGHLEQVAGLRLHACAVAVRVNFDEHRDLAAPPGAEGRQLARRLDAVEDHHQVAAARPQVGNVRQFSGFDADRVQDVGDAVGEELLGLLQCGYGDRTVRRGHQPPRDVDALGGLHVGTEADTEVRNMPPHPVDIPGHPVFVDHERRRGEVVELHSGHATTASGSRLAASAVESELTLSIDTDDCQSGASQRDRRLTLRDRRQPGPRGRRGPSRRRGAGMPETGAQAPGSARGDEVGPRACRRQAAGPGLAPENRS